MSKRKDRERAINQGLFHRGGQLVHIIEGKDPADIQNTKQIFLRCTKCGHLVTESLAEGHFKGCWGDKIPCQKCGTWVPVEGCLEHWKNCKGKEVKDAS